MNSYSLPEMKANGCPEPAIVKVPITSTDVDNAVASRLNHANGSSTVTSQHSSLTNDSAHFLTGLNSNKISGIEQISVEDEVAKRVVDFTNERYVHLCIGCVYA